MFIAEKVMLYTIFHHFSQKFAKICHFGSKKGFVGGLKSKFSPNFQLIPSAHIPTRNIFHLQQHLLDYVAKMGVKQAIMSYFHKKGHFEQKMASWGV